MLAGYTWSHVKCPRCEQINETPIDKIYISDWERFLELRFIKVTCPNCKKTIYCKRESEYVSCDGCQTIMTIVKQTPLRPGVFEHKFSKSVVVPNEKNDNNFKENKTQFIENKQINMNDTFKPLFQTVRENHLNLLYKQNNKKKK